ncbi:MAG: SDR family NAD(P)-dependent oxidoreductase [Acidobacteriota bacterium]
MNRCLVTGGTGFVGSNLVRRLVAQGHEVFLLVRARHATWRIQDIGPDVRLLEADVSDPEAVRRAVAEASPRWVFHLAAFGAYASQDDLARMLQVNVRGTANLIDACRAAGVEALVNAGSSSEYGFQNEAPGEDQRLEPNSHYAATKAAATHLCRQAARESGAWIPTLRLYSVFGPYEEPTRLIPTLIREGREGRLPPLVHPEIARDFVYVDDVVDACLAAAAAPNRGDPGAVYNVGTGTQTTLREVVDMARRSLGIAAAPQWKTMANRRWDTSSWVADSRKIRQELAWEPRFSLAEGFRRTVDWSSENLRASAPTPGP